MKFSVCGPGYQSIDSNLELRRLVPGLVSLGHELSEDPEVLLCYGSTEGVETQKDIILRWDLKTCSKKTLLDKRVRSVVFNSKNERDVWIEDTPTDKKIFVCYPPAPLGDPVKECPPGILSIRSSFDATILCASPEWNDEDYLEDAAKAALFLKEKSRNSCVVFMGDNQKYPLRGRDVFYVPWLEEKERCALFSISSYLVTASGRCEVPVEVVEALSQGTPVLHFNQPGVLDVVGRHGYAWDVPRDVPEYPWDLSAISPIHASKIFSDAFCVG